jgi:parallel beta-helix repeat protein
MEKFSLSVRKRSIPVLFSLVFFLFFLASPSPAQVIRSDTVWRGDVVVDGDVLVLPGAVLRIEPGTRVLVKASESSRTEPEYLSPLTEITVRGRLEALGGPGDAGIEIVLPDRSRTNEWAGIFVDGGEVVLRGVKVGGADSALSVIRGRAEVRGCEFSGNRYGVTLRRDGVEAEFRDSRVTGNDYGVVLLDGAEFSGSSCDVSGNREQDVFSAPAAPFVPEGRVYAVKVPEHKSEYGNESLLGTVVWRDHVVVRGVVRVPAKSRLVIMPGTVVEFSRRDSNGDGIGENGLLVMGMLVAKGTAGRPIVFRSAEKTRRAGDWDSINIYTSDGVQNVIEYCQVEDAYRAFHLHYSNVLVAHCVLRGNLRGLQFQESLVEVRDNDIYGNHSAVRARDSEVSFIGNRIFGNYFGPYFFRMTGEVRDNLVAANHLDGLRLREGALEVGGNYISGNRYGLTVAYAVYGEYSGNVLSANGESGLVLKGTDSVRVRGNYVSGNGINGISVLDSAAVISGNQVVGNGVRGLGLNGFRGVATGNNFAFNGEYAIGVEGGEDAVARGNWFNGDDVAAVVYDHADDRSRGRLDVGGVLGSAARFTWPVDSVWDDTLWLGDMVIPGRVEQKSSSTLKVAPGTVLRFARKASLWSYGPFEAVGTKDRRIVFTAAEDSDDKLYWDEFTTERTTARFAHCDFHNAYMAVHVHFSNVTIDDCYFSGNESGFRVRGGPVEVKNSLFEDNVYGMVSYLAKGRIHGNLFRGNDIGILIRAERRGGMHVNNNNIQDNHRYNMRMGDFNNGEDVDARNNWWGRAEGPGRTIRDARDEPGIGMIFYDPFATAPLDLNLPEVK